jgi:hypothetical protein
MWECNELKQVKYMYIEEMERDRVASTCEIRLSVCCLIIYLSIYIYIHTGGEGEGEGEGLIGLIGLIN